LLDALRRERHYHRLQRLSRANGEIGFAGSFAGIDQAKITGFSLISKAPTVVWNHYQAGLWHRFPLLKIKLKALKLTTMMQAFRAVHRYVLLAGVVLANPAMADPCAPFIEEHPAWASASFRPHTTAFETCSVDEERYRQVIADWLQRQPASDPNITSLSLGRAVTFPWLSRFIADTALRTPRWAGRMARAKVSERDKLARPVLHDPALLQRLAAPFADSRYAVIGLAYEKVLFGRADKYASQPAARLASNATAAAVEVPFDAQLWLRLAPRHMLAPAAE